MIFGRVELSSIAECRAPNVWGLKTHHRCNVVQKAIGLDCDERLYLPAFMSVLADFHLLPVDSQNVLTDAELFTKFRATSADELHATGSMVLALEVMLGEEGIDLLDSPIRTAVMSEADGDVVVAYDVGAAQTLLKQLAALKLPAELCKRHLELESGGLADPDEVAALVEGLVSVQRCLAMVTPKTLGVLIVAP
jgi:hypothetical protein